MPHTNSGLFANSSGPGCNPYCWNAASMMAAVAEVGSPSDSKGARTPAAAALLAASGPATASIAPFPNSSGFLARRFSTRYDRNVGISLPPAGNAPIGNPIAVPRRHGFQERARPWRVIHLDPLNA